MIVVILIVHILIVFILQVQRSEDVLPPKEPEPTQVIDTSEDELSEKPNEEDSKVKPKAEEEVILIMFISSCVHLDCNHLVFLLVYILFLFLFYLFYNRPKLGF